MVEEEQEQEDNVQEYSPKSDFSKAMIISNAITRTSNARGEEMIEGYHNFKFDKQGNAVKVWIPDTRKIFCSNVEATIQLLAPEIANDDRMQEVMKKFDEEKLRLFEKYCYKERERCRLPNGKAGWKLTGNKWIPKIDEEIITEDPNFPQSLKAIYGKGLYNLLVNRYWDEMLQLYDMVFVEINLLIATTNVNYFKKTARF